MNIITTLAAISLFGPLALSSGTAFADKPSAQGKYCSSVEVTLSNGKGKSYRNITNRLLDASCGLTKDQAQEVNAIVIGLLNAEFEQTISGISTKKKEKLADTLCVTITSWVGKLKQHPKKKDNPWISAQCGLTADEAYVADYAAKGKIGKILMAISVPQKNRAGSMDVMTQIAKIIAPK